MARTRDRLSDRQVRTAKPKGVITQGVNAGKARDSLLLADGGNLYLQVTTGADGNIRRSWLFRFKRPGATTRDMGLGSISDVSLAEAREKARKYRNILKEGDDPIAQRDSEKARKLAASSVVMTFEQAAQQYIAQHRSSWTNPTHAAQWPASLRLYAHPIIGKMSVADIDTAHVRKVLDPIWHDKPVTADRVRGRIEQVLGWATVAGYCRDENGHDKPNPARWQGHLSKALPSPHKVRTVKHQPALPYVDVPQFMKELRERRGMAALALELLALTVVRSADVRSAKRADFNLAERVWVISAFSKTAAVHKVPLSDAAITVIEKAKKIATDIGGAVAKSEYLFCNDMTGAAIGENAMIALIARMGRKGQMTAHGLRASFRTWALERSSFPWELCEISLGHTVGTKVERAYQRSDGFEQRIAIMQAWANFCAKKDSGKVVPMKRVAP